MRTHGFRTHVGLVLAGAFAVVAALGRPWYGHAPARVRDQGVAIGDVNGPLNGFFHALERAVTDPGGRTGWQALGGSGEVLAALAGCCAAAALACLAPAVRRHVQEPLRYAALAVLGLVAWRLVDAPGAGREWELRHGALVAAGGALVLAVCAQTVAAAPSSRRTRPPRYVAPPPPPPYDPAGSSAPPGL